MNTDRMGGGGMSVNRMFAYTFGAIYLLIGLIGFAVTTDVGFASGRGDTLLGFEVNPLHNIVHVLTGAAWLFAATRGTMTARMMNYAIGAAYTLVLIYGLIVANNPDADILAINAADNVLHFLTAALSLGIAAFADRSARTGRETFRRAA